ncbi:MAG TPA: CUAEP/CCAEP-tail radical SAM protein [Blastocatellia bacterium]|nr:CUAEP/CCAEP-tail radical SAM protein [Blastocatellia bacterium]
MQATDKQFKTVLLVSCYELGHQPAGLAMPLAFLNNAGFTAETMDMSVEEFDSAKAKRAGFAGISVPMHTALRLGVQVAREIRKLNPECHVCFYGLYASLNADYLLRGVADSIIGGEFEEQLVERVEAVFGETNTKSSDVSKPILARLSFPVPDRSQLVSLDRYAKLEHKGEQRLAGYVEASRGCLHLCTHCPIPPVYEGRFFVVPEQVVLEDIRRQVASGARHITFGDPDFLNGPGHSLNIARAVHQEFPELTFDYTAKIEHILKHRALMPEFGLLGCVFVVSAVESLSSTVLDRLQKGHSREDVAESFDVLAGAGITLRPSFVSFTPWTTIDDFIDVLEFVDSRNLIDHVDPVQYSIRLLVPPGSLLLSNRDAERWLGPLVQESFTYEWKHPDRRMDELQRRVTALVEHAANIDEDAPTTFDRIRAMAYAVKGEASPERKREPTNPLRARPPRLTEAWFCCAEPTRDQFVTLGRK